METRSLFRLNQYLFHFSALSTLSVALIICGCTVPSKQMYSGGEVSPDKRAVIRVSHPSSGKICIYSVDKKKTFLLVATFPEEVYILPGKHNIVVETKFTFTYAFADLWLVAEPGETYVIKSLEKGDRVRMWIENERTGQPVGGVTGSSDEPK